MTIFFFGIRFWQHYFFFTISITLDVDNMDAEEEGEAEEEDDNLPPGGDDVCAEKSNDKNKSDEKK